MEFTPLIPTVFAALAISYKNRHKKHNLILVEAVALSCALICIALWLFAPVRNNALWFLVVGFLLSIGGDFFMKSLKTNMEFVYGIALFLGAHLCFLAYALTKVDFSLLVFVVVLAPFLVLYVVVFLPTKRLQEHKPLAVAALVYLVVSCATLSVTFRWHGASLSQWLFTAAIASLVTSDTLIAFRELHKFKKANYFVMPLYYLCHILIAFSVVLAHSR